MSERSGDPELDAARAAWRAARGRYEAARDEDGADVTEAADALGEAGLALGRAVRAAASRLVSAIAALEPLRGAVASGLEALDALCEQEEVDAERAARHGLLAEASQIADERLGQVEDARVALKDAWAALAEARRALDAL